MTTMFVFGTLRPKWQQYDLTPLMSEVRTKGRMRSAFTHRSYPIVDFVTAGADDWVTGDLVVIDPNSKIYRYLCDMETGAGYVPLSIEVAGTNCLTWHYPDFDEKDTPMIESGDWVDWMDEENPSSSGVRRS